MSVIRGLSDRALAWLLGVAFLAVLIGGGVVWYHRHRDTTRDARYQAMQDSLRVVLTHLRDTVAVLGERYRVDTVHVRETTTVYRQAAARVDTVRLVTRGGDTLRVDTLPPVRALRLACDNALAARDTVISVCEQRLAAQRRLAVADSLRAGTTIAYLQQQIGRAGKQGRATGRKQGAILTAVALIAGAVALRQLIPGR